MDIFNKIRIKGKIHKMCLLMRKKMNADDVIESTKTIKTVLCQLPQEKKEGVLDVCLKVLKYGC